jgi:tetraacyldisaccharide 4'-kinase
MENWLLQHWYGEHRPPWYLRALEPVYRGIFNYTQRKGENAAASERGGLPLIVVGNVTVGGTGKTPLVMHLCRLAVEMGLRPGIASTGYRRQGSDTCLVQPESDPLGCGDEPVLLAKRTGVPVVVARRRADAVAKLREMGLDLVISDDGLQHADLRPDMEICVIDGDRGIGNGHLLPAGPLREPAVRLGQVDYVVTTGDWRVKPRSLDTYVMHLSPADIRSLDDRSTLTAKQFRQKYSGIDVHAIAAIGNPQRFFKTLGTLEIPVTPHVFPDHHAYRAEDFDSIPAGQAIIMTEKDAVKCRALGLADAWCLPVEAQLPEAFDRSFKERLGQLVEMRK